MSAAHPSMSVSRRQRIMEKHQPLCGEIPNSPAKLTYPSSFLVFTLAMVVKSAALRGSDCHSARQYGHVTLVRPLAASHMEKHSLCMFCPQPPLHHTICSWPASSSVKQMGQSPSTGFRLLSWKLLEEDDDDVTGWWPGIGGQLAKMSRSSLSRRASW